jgi:hypothetical protein
VEEDPAIQGALQGLVFLKIDTRNPEQNALADTHQVRGVPTFLMTNADGEVLRRWVGYSNPEHWVTTVDEIKRDPITVAARTSRHEAEPNFRDALALGKHALAGRACTDAERFFRDALNIDERKAKEADVPLEIFRAAYYGASAEEMSPDHMERIAAELLQESRLNPEYAFEITEKLVYGIENLGEERVIPSLRMAYPHLVDLDEPRYAERQNEFFINYALFVEKNHEQALRLKRAGMPEAWTDDVNQLNSFAWWCFVNELNLEEAEELAARGVTLAGTDGMRANVLDTQAEIVNALGRPQEAFELIARALELDPESEYLQHQYEVFEERANGGGEQTP